MLGVALLGTLVAARSGFTGGLHAGITIAAAAFFIAAGLAWAGVDRPASQHR